MACGRGAQGSLGPTSKLKRLALDQQAGTFSGRRQDFQHRARHCDDFDRIRFLFGRSFKVANTIWRWQGRASRVLTIVVTMPCRFIHQIRYHCAPFRTSRKWGVVNARGEIVYGAHHRRGKGTTFFPSSADPERKHNGSRNACTFNPIYPE